MSIIKRLIFGKGQLREYEALSLSPLHLQQRAYFRAGGEDAVDISEVQWLLCLEPMTVGIILPGEKQNFITPGTACRISFTARDTGRNDNKKNSSASALLRFFASVELSQGTLFLFHITASFINAGKFRERVFYRLFTRFKENEYNFAKFSSLAAVYAYPRRVCLISYRQGEYFSLFPMDLLGSYGSGNVLGLRVSNQTLPHITENAKVVVCDVNSGFRDHLYALGKYHSSLPPALADLPFRVIESEAFGFYVPEEFISYKEIRITGNLPLGEQMLLIGETINKVSRSTEKKEQLFHVHGLHTLRKLN